MVLLRPSGQSYFIDRNALILGLTSTMIRTAQVALDVGPALERKHDPRANDIVYSAKADSFHQAGSMSSNDFAQTPMAQRMDASGEECPRFCSDFSCGTSGLRRSAPFLLAFWWMSRCQALNGNGLDEIVKGERGCHTLRCIGPIA